MKRNKKDIYHLSEDSDKEEEKNEIRDRRGKCILYKVKRKGEVGGGGG